MRLAEPGADEKTLDVDLTLMEVNKEGETVGPVVITENSNFSSRYSLKLKMYTTYSLQLAIDPQLQLKYLKFTDKRFDLEDKESKMSEDGTKRIHTWVWTTGVKGVPDKRVSKTKNNKRFIVSSTLKLEGFKRFKYDFLVKFYREDEPRAVDGDELTSVGLEFIVPKDVEKDSDGESDDEGERKTEPSTNYILINNMSFNTNDEDE